VVKSKRENLKIMKIELGLNCCQQIQVKNLLLSSDVDGRVDGWMDGSKTWFKGLLSAVQKVTGRHKIKLQKNAKNMFNCS
jgi:hypothetical protein